MDRFSLYKKLSLVLLMSIFNMDFALANNCKGNITDAQTCEDCGREWVEPRENRYGEPISKGYCSNKNKMKSCADALKDATKAKTKFMNACKGGGASLGSCSEILDDCTSNAAVEEILDPGNVLSQVLGVPNPNGGRGNKCSEYSHTDYQNELRDLKREKKDAERELQDLQKEKIESEKEIAKAKAELQKEVAQAQKERAKEELEAKEEERNMEKARQDQERALKKQMRELQTQILNAQNAKAIMTASRAGEVDKYKVELMKCEVAAEKMMKEMRGNTSSSLANRSAVGSLSAAGAAKGNKKNAKAALMKGCVSEVTARRNAEAVAFQNKMKEKDEEIANAQAEMQEAQKSLQTLAQQFAQAAQDRATERAQKLAAYQAELKAKSDEFNNLNKEYVQTQARLAQALQKAQVSIHQASNELGSLQKEKPVKKGGSKSARDEMREAQSEYVGARCEELCAGTPHEDKCTALRKQAKEAEEKMNSAVGGAE